MKEELEYIRGLVRPLLTFIWTISWLIFLFTTYNSGGDISDIPSVFTAFVFAWNIEWAGERFLKHFISKG